MGGKSSFTPTNKGGGEKGFSHAGRGDTVRFWVVLTLTLESFSHAGGGGGGVKSIHPLKSIFHPAFFGCIGVDNEFKKSVCTIMDHDHKCTPNYD